MTETAFFDLSLALATLLPAALATLLALAAAALLWERLRLRRLFNRLDDMLDRALQGEFREEVFDESRLSAVEARLAQYLTASAAEARAIQEERDRIKALIADISHQTKTPIANVLLYAQLLGEQPLSPEGRDCLAALEGQTEKLRTLIEVLVKTSRLETGVLVLHPEPASLSPLLEDCAAQFSPQAAERGVALSLVPAEGAAAVFDPKWTAEALCCLLDNAVKYTPPGGSVTVQAVSYELFCRINVTDTGPGIPEEQQAKIFQRFYRAPAAAGREGVGIGLYLARQIAESQGGYIRVFSKPGKGAKFSLFLPRTQSLSSEPRR